ncbi:MAG: MarR family transcriptional regulator [Eubacteriales bacterium]|nr:MarR family transcriptional regulator [Eubacteriales bacterium]
MDACMISLFQNSIEIYDYLCQPVCKKYDIQQTSLNILLFLANNPGFNTAKDIHKYRGIKQSMVSFHVEKLVRDGYIERESVPEDRRQVKLVCTKKAQALIEEGRRQQELFMRCISEDVTEEDREAYIKVLSILKRNIMNCIELKLQGSLDEHIQMFMEAE